MSILLLLLGVFQKVRSLRMGGGGGEVIEKRTKTNRSRVEEGVLVKGEGDPSMCVRSLFKKKMLRFSK